MNKQYLKQALISLIILFICCIAEALTTPSWNKNSTRYSDKNQLLNSYNQCDFSTARVRKYNHNRFSNILSDPNRELDKSKYWDEVNKISFSGNIMKLISKKNYYFSVFIQNLYKKNLHQGNSYI